MKNISFWLARFTTILFGLAMMALVLPFLLSTTIAWHADATRFYVAQQEGSALLLHGGYILQTAAALLFGLAGYLLILDHYYQITLMITFTLCVLVAHNLLNGAGNGWIALYLPAMFFGCLGLLSCILTRWAAGGRAIGGGQSRPLSSQFGSIVV